MSPQNEAELIGRTLEGDRTAFDTLYRAYCGRIRRQIAGRISDSDTVDDLLQTTFLRAFRSLGSFRGDAAFGSWLTQIALNVCRSHVRSVQARRRWISVAEDPESLPDIALGSVPSANPEEVVQEKEWQALVMRGIQSLPERYRRALWMRYVRESSYEEIMHALQVPMGTVKTWICRARRQLKWEFREVDLQTIYS